MKRVFFDKNGREIFPKSDDDYLETHSITEIKEYSLFGLVGPQLKQYRKELQTWHDEAKILEQGLKDFPFEPPLLEKQ